MTLSARACLRGDRPPHPQQAAGHASPSSCRWPGSEGQKGTGRGRAGSHARGAGALPREGEDIRERAGGRRRQDAGDVAPSLRGVFHAVKAALQRRSAGPSRGPACGPRAWGTGRPSVCSPRSRCLPVPAGCGLPGEANLCTPKWGRGAETKAGRGFRTGTPVCSHAQWSPKIWAAGPWSRWHWTTRRVWIPGGRRARGQERPLRCGPVRTDQDAAPPAPAAGAQHAASINLLRRKLGRFSTRGPSGCLPHTPSAGTGPPSPAPLHGAQQVPGGTSGRQAVPLTPVRSAERLAFSGSWKGPPPPSGGAVGSCLDQRASTCPNGEQKWDVRRPRAGRADKQETHGGGAGTVRRQRSVCGVCAMPCAATPGRHPASSSETQTQAPRPGPRAGAHATRGAAPARHPATGGHPEGGPQNGCSRQAQEPWGEGFQLQVCDRFVTPNKHD